MLRDTDDERHYRHASREETVRGRHYCENVSCVQEAKYKLHTLDSEPVYCGRHLPAPPYHDLTYTRLKRDDQ